MSYIQRIAEPAALTRRARHRKPALCLRGRIQRRLELLTCPCGTMRCRLYWWSRTLAGPAALAVDLYALHMFGLI